MPGRSQIFEDFIISLESEFGDISAERKNILKELAGYIKDGLTGEEPVNLVFICTHNSRRSQFGQAWAEIFKRRFNLDGIYSFSGGTEATRFNPNAVAALERAGLILEKSTKDPVNPHFLLNEPGGMPSDPMFSKTYQDPVNPSVNFLAIMVCSDADEACPIVQGASHRISMPYRDPKEFDGTPKQEEKYNECCREIARDLYFVFRTIGDSNHPYQ